MHDIHKKLSGCIDNALHILYAHHAFCFGPAVLMKKKKKKNRGLHPPPHPKPHPMIQWKSRQNISKICLYI